MNAAMTCEVVELAECIGQVLQRRDTMNLQQLSQAVPYGMRDIAEAVEQLVDLGRVEVVRPVGAEPSSIRADDSRVYFRWKRERDGWYRWQMKLWQSVNTDRPNLPRYAEACL